MDNSKNRQSDNLGVNKMGKNIRKSPIHQPNFGNNASRQQPQPQVYNISKNDFRDIVQQLTGSPSHSQDPPPRPPHHPPKPQNNRLQRIRPPPLTPINRHPMPPPMPPAAAPPPVPYNNSFPRPAQFGQPSPTPMHPLNPGDMIWSNPTESPISAYMRYLQSSMLDPSPMGGQAPPQPQPQPYLQLHGPGNFQHRPPPSALLPNPSVPMLPSPRLNGPMPPVNVANPPMPPNFPSPQPNGPPPLPSPTSQFLLPSPTGFLNMLSPRSPYPLLSPGMPFPSPFTPNFPFSPMGQSGILGPGPQPPPSPGLSFPLSPSGYFLSPRWRDH